MPYKYLIIYVVSLVFSMLVNWFLLKRYAKWGVKDHAENGQERWVTITKPAVGGIGFFILFSLACVYIFALPSTFVLDNKGLGFVFAVVLGFFTGFVDDKNGMPPWFKFLGQFLCGVLLYSSGIFIELNNFAVCNFIISLFWVVGIMNSINMLDNMDGIAATTSYFVILACVAAFFGGDFYTNFHSVLLLFSIVVLGALSGFLKYNWASAKMYMGDSGSQFLGVFLAGVSMVFLWNFKDPNETDNFLQFRQFALPLLAFVVPIVDTSMVSVKRILSGKSPFVGGKDHTTHQLSFAGFTDGQVASVFMAINAFSLFLIYLLVPQIRHWHTAYTLGAFTYFVVLLLIFQGIYWYNQKK